MIIDLAKPDLRKVHPGTKVKTTKGFLWVLEERVNGLESWLDESTGITWIDTGERGINHHQADMLFSLPTKEEFETAEEHGIREVMDLSGRWFWSQTVHPDSTDTAYGFSGKDGYIDHYFRDVSYYHSAALAVRVEPWNEDQKTKAV